MTKERLEELIKQGATIRSDDFNEEIKLDPKNCRVIGMLLYNGFNQYLEVKEDEKHCPKYRLESLREDVDRAKWEREMTAERTERFEPPMWEDIELEKRYVFRFVINNEFIYFKVGKHENAKFNNITIFNITGDKMIFSRWDSDTTKENYEKACEIVRNLFNKEEK